MLKRSSTPRFPPQLSNNQLYLTPLLQLPCVSGGACMPISAALQAAHLQLAGSASVLTILHEQLHYIKLICRQAAEARPVCSNFRPHLGKQLLKVPHHLLILLLLLLQWCNPAGHWSSSSDHQPSCASGNISLCSHTACPSQATGREQFHLQPAKHHLSGLLQTPLAQSGTN